MVTAEENLIKKQLPRAILGGEDIGRLRARAVAMKRAAIGMQCNGKKLEEEADALIKLYDGLKTELSEP
jgi:hypothetical protein